jgi:murein DD-endopeptidase MepM/ murein hydrolase activator NlpD
VVTRLPFREIQGSSGGPHLHFDIRDPNNFALNPLLVESFPEITDNMPPAVEKIALKTLDINSRINEKFGRFEFYAQRVGNNFVFPVPIWRAEISEWKYWPKTNLL